MLHHWYCIRLSFPIRTPNKANCNRGITRTKKFRAHQTKMRGSGTAVRLGPSRFRHLKSMVRRNASEDMGNIGTPWQRRVPTVLRPWWWIYFANVGQLRAYTGHLARTQWSLLEVAVRTRLWKYQRARCHSKWGGVDPKRFKVWRWEGQSLQTC